MKRIFLILIVAVLGISAGRAGSNTSIILQHKGDVTMFEGTEMETAMNQAIDGDSILLSQGAFPGFTISKSITVRGEGNNRTQIFGNVTIKAEGDEPIDVTIEGVSLSYSNNNYNIGINGMTGNIKINKCKCYYLLIDQKGECNNLNVDKCLISYLFPSESVKTAIIKNTIISEKLYFYDRYQDPYSTNANNYTFINSDIRHLGDSNYARCNFINCILHRNSSSTETLKQCTLINCLINQLDVAANDCYTENCWFIYNYSTKIYAYTVEQLTEKGYIGNDGTVVGCQGGSTPFNMTLGIPRVSSSKIVLDNENKILNVDVTFESN